VRKILVLGIVVFAICSGASGSNCNGTSTGYVPLMDLGTGMYQGYEGGLYPGGVNQPPAAHFAAGLHEAMQIRKLDINGNPSSTGKIVFISVGMSNTTQEFSYFKPIADADPRKNPNLVIVDGAQGGKDAKTWSDPANAVWSVVDDRLTAAGVGPKQVQVVWLKQALIQPNKPFPADAAELQGYLKTIAQNIKARYMNTRIVYFSSRIYAGYASTTLNPEPYAYQSGFAVKWLITDQINGNPDLNFDPAKGTVKSPWLGWGPYLWADGLNPRSDGLIYRCSDFNTNDGTHPDTAARQKVSNMLLRFLKNDKTAAPWFTNDAYVPSSASQAKLLTDGNAVSLSGMAVTMGSGVIPGGIYVEEIGRQSGIRVIGDTTEAERSFVNVKGVLLTSSDDERHIDASSITSATSGVFPEPLAMTNLALGGGDFGGQAGIAGSKYLNNIGLLVTSWGRVTPIDSGSFQVTDGSKVDVRVEVPADVSVPGESSYALVTGLSSCWKDSEGLHRLILVRKQADISPY
jgi:hypothetical protein